MLHAGVLLERDLLDACFLQVGRQTSGGGDGEVVAADANEERQFMEFVGLLDAPAATEGGRGSVALGSGIDGGDDLGGA